MMYQVQWRQDDGPWQNYGYPAAVLRVGYLRSQCHREHPDCDTRVIRGTTQMQDYEAEQQSWEDRRRWAIEQGEGGNRDTPYVYKPPLEWRVREAWTRLLGRLQRGEIEL